MRLARKSISAAMAFFIAVGIIVSPFFAGKIEAATYKNYTGIEVIDNFLNDYRWCEGNTWTNSTAPKLAAGSGTGCYAYCADYTKYCFDIDYPSHGDSFYDINDCVVGDVITVGNPNTGSIGHWFIVIKRSGKTLTIAEGNAMDQVLMDREFVIDSENNQFIGDRSDRYFLKGYHFISSTKGWQNENGIWYYYDAAGNRVTGWRSINGTWYFFNSDGSMATGWQNIDGGRYYLGNDGAMRTGWILLDGIWYYLKSSGDAYRGWLYSGGEWYFLGAEGAMYTGFVNDNGIMYYMNSSGAMVTGWKLIDGTWYYFTGSGSMFTGWLYTGGEWYYLNDNGDMALGWRQVNGIWYFLTDSGIMAKGWRLIDGEWYYFDGSGALLTNRWLYSGGEWYYLLDDGKMAYDTTIDGYYVNAGGAWVA